MSIPTTPTTPTPDRQNLEPLQELKLKGFSSCNDTPTSKTASLPTPGGVSVPLANSAVVDDAHLGEIAEPNLKEWNSYDHDPLLTVPGAPLIKDLDSFTDGTGTGSFDYIPVAETDEQGYPIYTLSEARLSLVSAQDKDAYVLSWLETIPRSAPQASSTSFPSTHDQAHQHRYQYYHHHYHQYYHRVPTLKRPRSMTEYEEYRPRRPRTRSCPSSRLSDSIEPD